MRFGNRPRIAAEKKNRGADELLKLLESSGTLLSKDELYGIASSKPPAEGAPPMSKYNFNNYARELENTGAYMTVKQLLLNLGNGRERPLRPYGLNPNLKLYFHPDRREEQTMNWTKKSKLVFVYN